MKKYLLFILLLLPFCEGFAGSANCTVQKPAFAAVQDSPSVIFVSYPHTEFEITYHTASVSSHCRQQNLQSFLGTEHINSLFAKKFTATSEGFSQVSYSQYLFYIYPSHHFW